MKTTINVRVSKKRKNVGGWWIVTGKDRTWFPRKRDAIAAVLKVLRALQISVEPARRTKHWVTPEASDEIKKAVARARR